MRLSYWKEKPCSKLRKCEIKRFGHYLSYLEKKRINFWFTECIPEFIWIRILCHGNVTRAVYIVTSKITESRFKYYERESKKDKNLWHLIIAKENENT